MMVHEASAESTSVVGDCLRRSRCCCSRPDPAGNPGNPTAGRTSGAIAASEPCASWRSATAGNAQAGHRHRRCRRHRRRRRRRRRERKRPATGSAAAVQTETPPHTDLPGTKDNRRRWLLPTHSSGRCSRRTRRFRR
ncbi:unnamed protein product [Closterium sp. NIES-53]